MHSELSTLVSQPCHIESGYESFFQMALNTLSKVFLVLGGKLKEFCAITMKTHRKDGIKEGKNSRKKLEHNLSPQL